MRKWTNIVNWLLLALYIGYFAGTSFFVHKHQLLGRVVVHSHPFSTPRHGHSANCFQLLDLLQDRTSTVGVDLTLPDCIQLQYFQIDTMLIESSMIEGRTWSSQLRAPPVI